ncbi:MAG: CGNR zinc finger domain-containing protein [Candidatus Limnocylindria bacterium]
MTPFTVPAASDAARRQPAPGELELVRQFVNTFDVETNWEGFSTPAELSAWMVERGLLPAGRRLTERDLAATRELRETLREVLAANAGHASGAEARRRLAQIAARYPLRMRLNGGARLDAEGGAGVAPAVARLLGTIYDAMTIGTWERLKVCRNDACAWAFYDHSRNHSGAWCRMAVCGNRMKGRAFRKRHAGIAAG